MWFPNININKLQRKRMRPLVNKMLRVASCYCLIGVFLFQFGNPSNVRAQLIASSSNSMQVNSYYPVQIYKNSIPELQSLISINKENALLKDVLKEIAKKPSWESPIIRNFRYLMKRSR